VIVLTEEKIDEKAFRQQLPNREIGALVEFSGVVRETEKGRKISSLFYEIYPGMTEQELSRVEKETREKFSLDALVIAHRHGEIPVGETALWLQVFSCHRREALEAIEYAITRIKEIVPIWKARAAFVDLKP
jgi:molybdopterin synthase catalytic subunit